MAMTLQTFSTADAAGAALAADDASRYIGGGTLVVRQANEGDVSFSTYVRATDPALSAITVEDGRATLGASVTMGRIIADGRLAGLAEAARSVGGPAIRNVATVGGNLYAPAPYGDLAVALLALDATIEVGGGPIPLSAFLADRHGTYAHTVLKSVGFALPSAGSLRFLKVSRVKPKGISVVTIAALLEEKDGTITSARVAYGCMADRPIRAQAVEAALIGKPRTADGIRDALAVATDGTSPITDAVASAWYRSQVLPVHLGRLLLA
ncbi:FAD binding domain-containing protein [Chelativorans sp. M5D2P16]|uniref:FAD binding domain-containing protein n=1 Tax=Chelativorans sp. M5D2P16 TaxID=3095678 RepID=UPI002ACA4D1E|nr:FAD binding domain-containing protein [Chelativorans sp. M5D2P16]MDZ5699805.1 FAD binding domain-containing protein [Chelativorans sp. M5D2P16]